MLLLVATLAYIVFEFTVANLTHDPARYANGAIGSYIVVAETVALYHIIKR